MRLVVDASVAVKWVVEEEGRDLARRLLMLDAEIVSPDFVAVETSSVLWKKVRRAEMTRQQALAATSAVLLPFHSLIATNRVTGRAFEMALLLDHPIYDCLYLATAELLDAMVVTSDARLLDVLRKSRFVGLARHVAEFG